MFQFEPDKPIFVQGEVVEFKTQEELVEYLLSRLDNLTLELGEFQRSSRDLENELEYQVNELESKNRESIIKIDTLQDESQQWKSRYTNYLNDTQHKLNEYQQQISELTTMNDRLSCYIRELEQNNDDLERARRALAASLEDFEGQLNQQIERNVLLENEVSEKEELECVVQRLKEEARDLRHELIVNKNSSEQSARRKQLMLENSVSSVQKDSLSMQPSLTPSTIANDSLQTISDKLGEINLSHSSAAKTPDYQNSAHLKREEKSGNVDSTTSPMTPETTSRFSFPSISDKNSSSLSRSTESRSQQTSTPSSPTLPSFVMTPSSRISALNIVSDLLRKVGALESKLVSTKKATE